MNRQDPQLSVFLKRLGDSIKEARRQSGYRYNLVSHRMGTQESTLVRIMNGRCNLTVATLWHFAQAVDAELIIEFKNPGSDESMKHKRVRISEAIENE
jgi:transcriptional regulator with XRE-family HTH domain